MKPGDLIPTLQLETLRGERIDVPAKDIRFTHLQFRRFAGCPICNLHLRDVARRHAEIVAAEIREVAVMHSIADTMWAFQGDLPFDVVADPEKALYRRFGVGASLRSVADPRAWLAMTKGVLASHPSSITRGEGGHLGLPAEFLIARDGSVAAVKYGVHAYDQWSVDELLELARKV